MDPRQFITERGERGTKRIKCYRGGLLFVTAEWIIVRNSSLGLWYPGCFTLSLFCVRRLKGLELRAGSPSLAFIPLTPAASTIAVYICSVQPSTYSID